MSGKLGFKTVENKWYVKNGVGRLLFAVIAIFLEIAFIVLTVSHLNEQAEWLSYATRIVAMLLVLGIYSQYKTSSMKTPWIILILLFPVLGTTLYLMVGLSGSTRKMARRYHAIDQKLLKLRSEDDAALADAWKTSPEAATVATYLSRTARYPLYHDGTVTYYDDAAKALEAQKEAMKAAKQFIFLEYHAIEHAESWLGIETILTQKAKEGVEVRVIYDDVGSITFINTRFIKHLRDLGIKCRVFNPMGPVVNVFLNNRDHRKITVVDGTTAFTGGYNLANEYFNLTHPFGHWKDTGVKLTGPSAATLTAVFLEMWNAVRPSKEDEEVLAGYERIMPHSFPNVPGAPFIQPYADNPMGHERIGENVYISIIEQAKHRLWFITPYLIPTDEMIHAFGLAAKRGVDVRIITPGIPDKKVIYSLTRSYYNGLARNGVRIYEYTPGFCHAKMCTADGVMATCGTINLDYRSLFHHFENGCFFFRCQAVQDIEADFASLFKESREVTEKYVSGRSAGLRFGQLVLRLFAPLL